MSFAHTKIQPPRPRAAIIERTALSAQLAEALAARKLILLCAPAGYGKTTALAHQLARQPAGHAVAWVSADEGDDLQRLLECTVAALEPVDPPWRTAPEALVARAGRAAGEEARALAAELINTLDACDAARGTLVFDDLHRVDDPAFFRFLDLLLERLGPRWCVAVTSRTDPPLALARLRANDELAEFRQLQLQFARDEAQQLAAAAALDPATADRLFERTHGWPAGLRIAIGAALAARNAPAPGGAAPAPDRALRAAERPMFEYLVTEVLGRLRPELCDFLLRASVLHELDAVRCAQVTGRADAEQLLDEIERLGLFVSVIDGDTRTLRLHDLFRDALRQRLRAEQPAEWTGCLQRAAAGETDPVRRQELLLAAGRPQEAAEALLAAAPSLNLRGAAPTVLRLCAAFAAPFAESSAELQRVLGLAKQSVWQLQDAERHYARAQALYEARGDASAAQLAAVRRAAVLVPLGQLSLGAQILAAVEQTPPTDSETQMMAATAALWLALERGEFNTVAARFGALLQIQVRSDRVEDWQTIPPPRVTVCRGVAPLLAQWADGALRVAGEQPVPMRAYALLAQGWSALWQARLQDAAVLLERAEAGATWVGEQVIARSHGLALRALLALARGQHATALQAMRERIDAQPAGYGGWGLWHALFVAARVAAACGDADTTRAWLARTLALHPQLPEASPARLHPVRGLQGTAAWLQGRRDEAIAHWRAALAAEEACDLMGQAGEVRVRLAAAHARNGALDEAAACIAPLLQGADEGPRGAVFAKEALAELAQLDWRGRIGDEPHARLFAWAQALGQGASTLTPDATRSAAPASPPDEAESIVAGPGGRLSARELEVLARIARGDSNKLIARTLNLSPHTVKRHVANVLDKLDLASRGQAAAWYRGNVG